MAQEDDLQKTELSSSGPHPLCLQTLKATQRKKSTGWLLGLSLSLFVLAWLRFAITTAVVSYCPWTKLAANVPFTVLAVLFFPVVLSCLTIHSQVQEFLQIVYGVLLNAAFGELLEGFTMCRELK